MKVLFICKYNRFRSKVAEIILTNISNFEIESRGIILDNEKPYIANDVITILQENGYFINDHQKIPRKVDLNQINNYDIIIIVADNVDIDLFDKNKSKIIKWDILDIDELDTEGKKRTIQIIENKVKTFLKEMKNIKAITI